MKHIAALVLFASAASASALTLHTSPFIAAPTATNNFEAAPAGCCFDGTLGYTEQGITATYVGGPGAIWTDGAVLEGLLSWYPNGGSVGFTQITFGGVVDAVQFLAGSGWFGGEPTLYYEVLLGGVSIGSGVAGPVPIFGAGGTWYGFSGASFDEVRLQVRVDGGSTFDSGAYEAGAFDMIQIGSAGVVPEPGTWAMLIAGFGLVGAASRRRRTIATA